MPSDKSGKFHLNSQRAHAADRSGSIGGASVDHKAGLGGEQPAQDGPHTTLHDHQDGTFHTEGHDGEHAEHPSFDHAVEHMRGKHGGGMSAEHDMAMGDPKDCY